MSVAFRSIRRSALANRNAFNTDIQHLTKRSGHAVRLIALEDLTQMTYGLSRDDAGRFMSNYVQGGVFNEDPFHILDENGVGELLTLGAERGRKARPELRVSICGEHGGNPESIAFCRNAGFDYVSCSPFRVPVAKMAAAHLALKQTVSN